MEKIYEKIKLVYICVLVAYTAVREVPALNFLISSNVVSAAVFLAGFLIILAGLCIRADAFYDRRTDLLIIFTVITAVSCLINRKYGIVDNVKAVGTMALFYFLLFPSAQSADRESSKKELRSVFAVLSAVWTLFVIVSICMYIYTVEIEVIKPTGELCTQGFSTRLQRLWGIFQDPNFAGFVCVAVMAASVYFFAGTKKIFIKVVTVLVLLLNFIYILLGGSRSAQVVLLAAAVIFTVYSVLSSGRIKKASKKTAVRICAGLLSAVAVSGMLYAGDIALSYILPYARNAAVETASENTLKLTDDFYAKLFDISGLEIRSSNLGKTPGKSEARQRTDEDTKPIKRTDLEKDDISNGRFIRWEQTLQIFKDSPLFGTSPRNISEFAKEHEPDTLMAKYGIPSHNGYIDVLTGTGVAGFAVMMAFFVLCAIPAVKKFLSFEGDREFILSASVFISLAVSGMFVSDLFFLITPGAVLFWYTLGHTASYGEGEKKHGLLYKPCISVINKLKRSSK